MTVALINMDWQAFVPRHFHYALGAALGHLVVMWIGCFLWTGIDMDYLGREPQKIKWPKWRRSVAVGAAIYICMVILSRVTVTAH